MVHKGINFSGQEVSAFEDGDVLEDCNCTQDAPHTPFGEGVKGLVFRRCSLINCDLPADAVVEGGCHVHLRKAKKMKEVENDEGGEKRLKAVQVWEVA